MGLTIAQAVCARPPEPELTTSRSLLATLENDGITVYGYDAGFV
jgi:hypothetical protein